MSFQLDLTTNLHINEFQTFRVFYFKSTNLKNIATFMLQYAHVL